MSGHARLRLKKWGRRLFVALSVAALLAGMATAVERTSDARSLSREIGRLQQEADAARARASRQMRRLDSLTSRERILEAARRLDLRPATEDEITFLREAAAGRDGGSGDEPGGQR